MRYLPLLWAGLFRKKTRTILTLLSVCVAFLLFGLLHAVTVAFESGADSADAKRLLTTARYSIIELLPIAYLRRIEQVPGVVGVAYAEWFGAKYQNESNAFPVFAVDPRRYLDMYPEFTIPHDQREAFVKTRTGAVAGTRLVQRYGWKLGQKVPISSEIHPKADGSMGWEFDLVGILDADDPAVRGNTDVVLINGAYFDEARQSNKGRTGWYIERIADSDAGQSHLGGDRCAVHELSRRNQDPARKGVCHWLRQADRRYRGARPAHPGRGVLHHSDLDRQHHGPVDPRAHSGTRHPQDDRFFRRPGDGARAGGGGRDAPARQRAGHAGRDQSAPRHERCHWRPFPAAVRGRQHLADCPRHGRGAGARHRPAPGAAGLAPQDRRGALRTLSPGTTMRWLNQAAALTVITLRTIPQRLGTSLVVVIGIAGVVGVLVSVLAMSEGFRHTLASTGRYDRVIMLRAGSDSEMSSGLGRDQTTLIAPLPGVARDAGGSPLASAELMVMVDLPRQGQTDPNNVPFRGVQPAAFAIRDELRIVAGRRFERGVREVIVGKKAAQEFAGLTVGSTIDFRDSDWTVVGIFETGGDVHESEIWADAEVTMSAFRRVDYQSITARLADGSDTGFTAFKDSVSRDPRFSLSVLREPEYYARQAKVLSDLINMLGYTVAAFMAIGAIFGALNCMYSAIASRQVEIATLRAIGFGGTPVVIVGDDRGAAARPGRWSSRWGAGLPVL